MNKYTAGTTRTLAVGRRNIFITFVAVLLIAAACRPPELHGTEMTEPFPAPGFTLIHANGTPVSLSDYQNQVVLLYFGYTFCPDVCPSTLLDLKQVMGTLGDDADAVQVIMVTVDPQRDSAEVVDEYVTHFYPDFIGLSGNPEEIAAVTSQYGIYYQAHEGTAATGYLVDHTASVILIDKAGNFRMTYPFGTPREDIASDLQILINEG